MTAGQVWRNIIKNQIGYTILRSQTTCVRDLILPSTWDTLLQYSQKSGIIHRRIVLFSRKTAVTMISSPSLLPILLVEEPRRFLSSLLSYHLISSLLAPFTRVSTFWLTAKSRSVIKRPGSLPLRSLQSKEHDPQEKLSFHYLPFILLEVA